LTLAYKLRSLGHLRNAAVARRFMEDMRAYFAEKNAIKRDEIAGRQMSVLRQYQGPREKSVRILDIKEMFHE
jgi:hypothetical protein